LNRKGARGEGVPRSRFFGTAGRYSNERWKMRGADKLDHEGRKKPVAHRFPVNRRGNEKGARKGVSGKEPEGS